MPSELKGQFAEEAAMTVLLSNLVEGRLTHAVLLLAWND